MDLWTWCIRTSRNDVGLSPVSVVGPCEQARPPYTPRVDGADRSVGHRDCPDRRAAWCFSTTRSLAHHARPDCDPSRSVLAWPLRQRPLPGAAGCVPFPEGKFEQGFLDGHGPAQVGLSPPLAQRLTAPFATQSTTPAVHTSREPRASAGSALARGSRLNETKFHEHALGGLDTAQVAQLRQDLTLEHALQIDHDPRPGPAVEHAMVPRQAHVETRMFVE
jgi:hypothetical protein